MKQLLFIALSLLGVALGAQAQKVETITLPFSFCNQTQWKAIETTIQLSGEEEEQLAYELQDFKSITNVQRSGKVYYVPQALGDRVMLVMKGVNIRETHPNIIDNQTNKTLILCIEDFARLNSPGSIIRSNGPVQIFGAELNDDEAVTTTLSIDQYKSGGRASIEARGDVYLQNLLLTLRNESSYAIRTVPSAKEGAVLTLNHVIGKIYGKTGSTTGFTAIEGTGSNVEGVEITDIEDEGDEEEAEEVTESVPLVGGNLIIPYSIMGQSKFDLAPSEKVYINSYEQVKAIPLDLSLKSGKVYYIDTDQSLLFDNANLDYNGTSPIVKHTDGGMLTIRFVGENTIKTKGDVFVSQGAMTLTSTLNSKVGNTLNVTAGGNFATMKGNNTLAIIEMDIDVKDAQIALLAEGSKSQLIMSATALKTKVKDASVEGFYSINCSNCGPIYGYWQSPLYWDMKTRTFVMGGARYNEVEFNRKDEYLVFSVENKSWHADDAQRVNIALEKDKNSKR